MCGMSGPNKDQDCMSEASASIIMSLLHNVIEIHLSVNIEHHHLTAH